MIEHPFVCIIWSHANNPFSEPFKDVFIKRTWLTICPGGTNSLQTISLLSKKQININLIFNLIILAFFGRGEFAVCHFLLYLLVSGSYSKIHNSSPVIIRLTKSCSLVIFSRRSRNLFFRMSLLNYEDFWHDLLHAQMFCQTLMNSKYVQI